MFAFTPAEIGLTDAVALVQLVNGIRQLVSLIRGHDATGQAAATAVAAPLARPA